MEQGLLFCKILLLDMVQLLQQVLLLLKIFHPMKCGEECRLNLFKKGAVQNLSTLCMGHLFYTEEDINGECESILSCLWAY